MGMGMGFGIWEWDGIMTNGMGWDGIQYGWQVYVQDHLEIQSKPDFDVDNFRYEKKLALSIQ